MSAVARAGALAAAAALFVVAGCGDRRGAPAEPAEPEAAERPTVFDPVTDTLERARSVEDTVLEQAEEQRRRIEEAERGE